MSDGSRREYVNCVEVGFSFYEFVLRFGLVKDPGGAFSVRADVVTTPAHAKAFLRALERSLRQYEESFGTIPDPAAGASRDAS